MKQKNPVLVESAPIVKPKIFDDFMNQIIKISGIKEWSKKSISAIEAMEKHDQKRTDRKGL
jgi:hypothetical protein